jgi:flagellar assembly protein FliH
MPIPVKAFEYPRAFDAGEPLAAKSLELVRESELPATETAATAITEADLTAAYEKGRQAGSHETEQRFSEQLAQAVAAERTRVSKIITEFQHSSADYYSKVEDQVVHLALGIAAKILHRESQVDPLLVAALVKLATENLKQGSHVQVNIRPEEIRSWQSYFEQDGNGRVKVELVEDPTLAAGECVVHSEVGVAALGIEAQLKEIERGLFDLLAQRPKND